jgi:zinc-binding alcohol dehydrogenase/oxidoreductase
MRAAVLNKVHEPLAVTDLPDPIAEPGSVVVRLRAAALNHRDAWIRKAMYARIRLPCVLGSDGAGEVESVGMGVDPTWLGRRVVIHPSRNWGNDPRIQGKDFVILGMPDQGTLAERIAVPLSSIEPLPAHLSFREGAAFSLAALTAYRALVTCGQVQPGQHLLITGIGGGVATLALTFAKALGAIISVTSSSPDKLAAAKALGASFGVSYSQPGWDKELVKQAGSAPSLIIDGAGGDGLNGLVGAVAPGGRIVMYGAHRGPPNQLDLPRIFFKQVELRGTTMGSEEEFRAMLALVAAHELKPVVDRAFALEAAEEAMTWMDQSGQMGKIVVDT